MNILEKLKPADYLTLTGLFFSWLSILLLIKGQPNWAIVIIMVAFIFDLLDGFLARKSKQDSRFGRELDSYGDIFIYLVFSSLLFSLYLSPNLFASLIIGFLLLMFGGLRLIRFNIEGMKIDKERKYYQGITVVHIMFFAIICYFLNQLTQFWTSYFSAITLLIAAPTMISGYKSYKINNYWIFALVIFSIIAISIVIEYAYL